MLVIIVKKGSEERRFDPINFKNETIPYVIKKLKETDMDHYDAIEVVQQMYDMLYYFDDDDEHIIKINDFVFEIVEVMYIIEENVMYCDGFSCSLGGWSEEANARTDWKPQIHYGLFKSRKICEEKVEELMKNHSVKFRVAEIRIND